jgi:heme o synthase
MKTGAVAIPVSRARVADYVALTKPRLNALVVATTMAGYYLGSALGADLATLIHTTLGTALVAGGAAALNQVSERDLDALMRRTMLRPVADGRVSPADARLFGVLIALVGLGVLATGANVLAAAVALATLVSYAAIYTPLKRRTAFATVIGAVPGALPPVIGWAAARGRLDAGAWALFAIVFLWQVPHFLAIAWIYRDEYARAGLPLLPVLEPDGRSTARQAVLYAAALLPASLAPAALGVAGAAYFAGALVLGVGFLALTARFAFLRTAPAARWLFFGSIIYLPLLWALMIVDKS